MPLSKPRLKKDRRTQKKANQRRAILRIEYDNRRRERERGGREEEKMERKGKELKKRVRGGANIHWTLRIGTTPSPDIPPPSQLYLPLLTTRNPRFLHYSLPMSPSWNLTRSGLDHIPTFPEGSSFISHGYGSVLNVHPSPPLLQSLSHGSVASGLRRTVDHLRISMTMTVLDVGARRAQPRWMWIDEDPHPVDH